MPVIQCAAQALLCEPGSWTGPLAALSGLLWPLGDGGEGNLVPIQRWQHRSWQIAH